MQERWTRYLVFTNKERWTRFYTYIIFLANISITYATVFLLLLLLKFMRVDSLCPGYRLIFTDLQQTG